MVWLRNPAKRRTFLAISPPSDIVLDVARAVDPTDIEAARAALAKRANGVGGAFSVDMAASVDAGSILSRATADKAAANADPASKFKSSRRWCLQTFIQNMLPKDTEGVYGKGLAGDMWKSQLAERVADVMAERGGIGIAKSMLADHYQRRQAHRTDRAGFRRAAQDRDRPADPTVHLACPGIAAQGRTVDDRRRDDHQNRNQDLDQDFQWPIFQSSLPTCRHGDAPKRRSHLHGRATLPPSSAASRRRSRKRRRA